MPQVRWRKSSNALAKDAYGLLKTEQLSLFGESSSFLSGKLQRVLGG